MHMFDIDKWVIKKYQPRRRNTNLPALLHFRIGMRYWLTRSNARIIWSKSRGSSTRYRI